ncbi:MAG: hypothetical protein L6R36_008815 [Xanthoria steineri]|nr:MAG: hypothetical protein L6R36_008815 [Xanthoria steineri]
MATVKRPPPSQHSHQTSKDHPPKRILRGFPPAPPTSLPPAPPRHPSQWAANLNVNITDIHPPPTIPPPQPTQQHNPNRHLHASSTSPPPKNLQHPLSPPLNTRAPPPSKPQHTPATTHLLLRFAEAPMPHNATDMTMQKCLDRILIPRYLAANPRCPPDGGARCRERYKTMMRFRHMKLVSRVERWRLYLPETQEKNENEENEGDAELQAERHVQKNDLDIAWREDTALQRSLRQQRRKQRDRENLTDFVNGEVAGVGRGRLMCWPVLIERFEWENCWSREDLETIGQWEEPGSEFDGDWGDLG